MLVVIKTNLMNRERNTAIKPFASNLILSELYIVS